MPKLKITQKQYDTILLHEQQSRLKASGDLLTENLNESTQLLEEGWREVVLGVAMMLGVGLTGQNKVMAQDAVKNATTMAQIKATLEDEGKVGELVDALKTKGMKDPETKLAQNAEKVVDAYNRIAADDDIKYKVDVKVVNNLQALKGKLGQGYALKNADMSTDTVHTTQQKPNVEITDTMEINLGSDNLFVTGGYTLSPAGVDTITIAMAEIKKQGGKIQSVEIESSTDAEEIVKFKNESDPTGNIKLANLRTQSVSNLIGSIENVPIQHREIPNNGSQVVSTQQFLKVANNPKATAQLRQTTSEFRYVKIKIVATFDRPDTTKGDIDVPKIVQSYRFELVKITESTGKTHKIKTSTHFKQKKFKCKRPKGDHSPIKCSFQR
jgi:flagellar motor protein MotB